MHARTHMRIPTSQTKVISRNQAHAPAFGWGAPSLKMNIKSAELSGVKVEELTACIHGYIDVKFQTRYETLKNEKQPDVADKSNLKQQVCVLEGLHHLLCQKVDPYT